jgi:crotonobetainyl-CoA:carnitine CoA-transferase CaiB-like acyl-CoA transferase
VWHIGPEGGARAADQYCSPTSAAAATRGYGVLAALVEATSGQGQVVDAAMVDGGS